MHADGPNIEWREAWCWVGQRVDTDDVLLVEKRARGALCPRLGTSRPMQMSSARLVPFVYPSAPHPNPSNISPLRSRLGVEARVLGEYFGIERRRCAFARRRAGTVYYMGR